MSVNTQNPSAFALDHIGDLVGRPYRDGARGPDAFDCWGIVLEAYARFDVHLPVYADVTAHDLMAVANRMKREPEKIGFSRIKDSPRFLDVVVMRPALRPDLAIPEHVALCLDHSRILHADELSDSCIKTLLDPDITSRVLGIYRHTAFAHEVTS